MGFWPEDSCRSENSQKLGMVLFDIISPIEGHSKKPDEAREKIVALMGDVPRVELFARQTAPGWDVWGNEVEPTEGLRDILELLTKCSQIARNMV